jgi:hypothetical protein
VGDQKLVLEQIQPLIDAKIIPAATIVNAEGESPSAAK